MVLCLWQQYLLLLLRRLCNCRVVLCDYVSALILRAECYVGKQNYYCCEEDMTSLTCRRREKSEEVNVTTMTNANEYSDPTQCFDENEAVNLYHYLPARTMQSS